MSDKLARAQHTRVADLAHGASNPAATGRPGAAGAPASAGDVAPGETAPAGRRAAAHARAIDPGCTSEIFVGGRHAGLDRTVIAAKVADQVVPRPQPRRAAVPRDVRVDGSGAYANRPPAGGAGGSRRHAGIDRTATAGASGGAGRAGAAGASGGAMGAASAAANSPTTDPGATGAIFVGGRHAGVDKTLVRTEQPAPTDSAAEVGSSAALISVCVMISRVLGFVRTWAMAFALGSTLLASSYSVAYNLPSLLYELVIGGMLVTAFLPVYLSVKKKLGQQASNEYASNLLTIVVVFLGVVSALCIAFPSVVIYTQSFYSDQAEMSDAVFFFQFFAIQIVFYGAGAIISGLLNANRDYLWSSIAPAANNVIVIASFLLYVLVAPQNQQLALYIIAIGNPLGVFVQLAIQLPALKKNGIRIRPRINFRDPALRETLGIGIPTVFVMVCSFAVVSVQNAAAYSFADNGPSILTYARLWFTLPYSFLAVPITTAMFTELADMQAEGNADGVKRGIVSGTNQILFFMIPFAMYLMVFALPLVTLYNAGAFTMENVSSVASYLTVWAFALPLYGVNTYLQKIFSSLRKMGVFAAFNFVAGAVQISLTMFGAANIGRFPIEIIAAAEVMFYVVADICLFAYLRRRLGPFGLRSVAKAVLSGLVFGGLGAAAGGGVLFALQTFVGPLSGSIPQAFGYVIAGGVVALVVTFGLSMKLHVPEAAFVTSIVGKVKGKLGRSKG